MVARPASGDAVIGLALFDELLERTAKPRDGNVAVGCERPAQLFPPALVAEDAPALDQLRAGELVGKGQRIVGQVAPPPPRLPRTIGRSASAGQRRWRTGCEVKVAKRPAQ